MSLKFQTETTHIAHQKTPFGTIGLLREKLSHDYS